MVVQVFDGVLSAATSSYLHAVSSLGKLGDEEHTAFQRAQPAQTALERCILSLLQELGDESPCVEYWWRDEWVHVEAHEDLDEELFAQSGERRYPTHAHVLYLEVAQPVRAPTCVWERRADGRGRADFGPLTTVPAVAGRLLRFPGALSHAVPKPATLWLPATHAKQPRRVAGERELVRSVVLFNTWSEPPLAVGRARQREDPEVHIRRLATEFGSPKLDKLVDLIATSDAYCQPRTEWAEVQPARRQLSTTDQSQPRSSMQVPLLGGEARRQQPERSVLLDAPDGLEDALLAEATVSSFHR